MDKRWELVDPIPCPGAVSLTGAGFIDDESNVNAEYCPVDDINGKPAWIRIGGDLADTSDAMFWQITGTPQWEVYANGTLVYSNPDGELHPLNGSWVAEFAPPDQPPTFAVVVETVIRELNPIGLSKFSEDEDLSLGLIAKRRKLTSDLVFIGADYDYFRPIERNPTRRCEELVIRRMYRCGGRWQEYWRGTFSTGAGTWDFDNCQFTVRPEVLDPYTCIMRALDKKVNVLQVAPVTATAIVSVSLEWGGAVGYAVASPCDQTYNVDLDGGGLPINGWAEATSFVMPTPIGGVLVYWRERIVTFCVGGVPAAPPGVGWTLLTDNCATLGTAVYVRPPTISYTFGDPVPGTCVDGVPIPPDDSCNWQLVIPCPPEDCGITSPDAWPGPYFVCYNPEATELTRARPLMEVVEFMLEQSGCEITGLLSDFFEHNPPGTAPGYAPGINYVTGAGNEVNALVIVQNSDAADPTATNPATLGELTLKEVFLYFVNEFQVYWSIDGEGNARFEHWIFWTFPVGLNVATWPNDDKSEPLSYTHLHTETPRIERLKATQAINVDFVGADIEYSGPCVTSEGEGVKQYALAPFMQDISFVLTDPDAINKEGFVVLATAFDGANYNTIIGLGALSGNFVTNSPLSNANVQANYWTWNRFLFTGRLNRQDVTFDGIQPNIEQKGVFVKLCCTVLDFDSTNRVLTTLGHNLGDLTAFVRRLEFDENEEGGTFTLRYAY